MRMILSSLAVLGVIATGGHAIAEDKPVTPEPAAAAPAAGTPAATSAVPAASATPPAVKAPAAAAEPAAVATPAAPAQPVMATLKDGSKIEMDSDGSVLVLNADGAKTPAPDGVLTLRDSTTFAVKNGKRLDY